MPTQDFVLRIEEVSPDTVLAVLAGELDLAARRTVEQSFGTVMNRAGLRRLDLDLTGLTYIDCSVIGALAGARNEAGSRGVAIHVHRPGGLPLRVFQLAGATGMLTDLPRRELAGLSV